MNKKDPYFGALEEKIDERDYQLCSGMLNLPEPSCTFDNERIEYEQNEVSNVSCTLHGALGALSDNLGIRFSLEERKELWKRALELGAQEGFGWYVNQAVNLVRDFAREKGYDVLTFRVMLGSEEFYEAIKLGYSVTTGYRGNGNYNRDIKADAVLDGTDFGKTTYGHCLRMLKDQPKEMVDNYPQSRPNSNIYRIKIGNLPSLLKNGYFFTSGHVFVNRADFQKENPIWSNATMWAVSSVKKAIKKKIATKWNNPQKIIGDATAEQILINLGALTQKLGNLSKERYIVALDNLGLLE